MMIRKTKKVMKIAKKGIISEKKITKTEIIKEIIIKIIQETAMRLIVPKMEEIIIIRTDIIKIMIMIMTMITKETITIMRMIAIITDLKMIIDITIIEEMIEETNIGKSIKIK